MAPPWRVPRRRSHLDVESRTVRKPRRWRVSHDFGANRRLEEAAEHGHSGPAPMLPAPLQFIVAMIAYAINQRMARRVDYLQEEVRVLKEALAAATGRTRIHFSAEQRRRLALKGKELTADERRACCQIVRPETILAWFRQLPVASRRTAPLLLPRGCMTCGDGFSDSMRSGHGLPVVNGLQRAFWGLSGPLFARRSAIPRN
jgi:hypothetical protein